MARNLKACCMTISEAISQNLTGTSPALNLPPNFILHSHNIILYLVLTSREYLTYDIVKSLGFITCVQKESICVKMLFFPEEFANDNIFFSRFDRLDKSIYSCNPSFTEHLPFC